ncbi:hypothetical protein RRG08_038395 [Elysia crispata]|uniref:Uncharacterized protein n=1 Tax=Elysia crispata TaxID=231223 RepID=A0AAE1A8K6_9GAST|nr:hypothetical protein RRG08_038395 [Elysia crispata]
MDENNQILSLLYWYLMDENNQILSLPYWYLMDENNQILSLPYWYLMDENNQMLSLRYLYLMDENNQILSLRYWYLMDENNQILSLPYWYLIMGENNQIFSPERIKPFIKFSAPILRRARDLVRRRFMSGPVSVSRCSGHVTQNSPRPQLYICRRPEMVSQMPPEPGGLRQIPAWLLDRYSSHLTTRGRGGLRYSRSIGQLRAMLSEHLQFILLT